jgi:hypothetical protein
MSCCKGGEGLSEDLDPGSYQAIEMYRFRFVRVGFPLVGSAFRFALSPAVEGSWSPAASWDDVVSTGVVPEAIPTLFEGATS